MKFLVEGGAKCCYIRKLYSFKLKGYVHLAGVAKLVDALDLGSSDLCRGGSSPSTRTTNKYVIH